MKATRCEASAGARKEIDTPSNARAVSAPKVLLTAATMAVVVVKSCSRTFIITNSVFSNGVSTIRSTVAPLGMRAEVGTPTATLEPAALASIPVVVTIPCAKAYTSPSTPRKLVMIKVPPRKLLALPKVPTLTSIR